MKYTKAYKMSLEDNVTISNVLNAYIGSNMIEVQLLSLHDPLDKMYDFADKITTIHLPLDKERDYLCNIDNVLKGLYEEDEYGLYLDRLGRIVKNINAGLVIHATLSPQQVKQHPGYSKLLDYIRKYNVVCHIENIISEIKDENDAIHFPVEICRMINRDIGKEMAFPLLDICHFQIVNNRINSTLRLNLKETIDLYKSDNMKIHFNSATGSGDKRTGGFHSDNFANNTKLLDDLLKLLQFYNPTLILECNEDDLRTKQRARWLNNYIEKFEMAN